MGLGERLRELWRYRELIRNLIARDLKARYKNSVLGVAWSWVHPLLMMLVYTVVFTILTGRANMRNYPVFLLCALLPWNFFTASVSQATNSIVAAAPLVKKVYFPREVLTISVVLSNLVNFLIALPVFFALALVMGNPITWAVLLLPVTILVQLMFTIGVAFIAATLNVFYRDTDIIMGVLLLAWFFLTPVFYPISTVPASYELWGQVIDLQLWLRRLNPMASIVASYRDLLYHGVPTGWDFLLRTALTSLIVLVVGYLFFQHFSPRFGEEV
jgi:ABC-type polysaccharide/polyol phosphate export permease